MTVNPNMRGEWLKKVGYAGREKEERERGREGERDREIQTDREREREGGRELVDLGNEVTAFDLHADVEGSYRVSKCSAGDV